VFLPFSYYHARALLPPPLASGFAPMQFIVALSANLTPRARRVQLELLFRQFPSTILASHRFHRLTLMALMSTDFYVNLFLCVFDNDERKKEKSFSFLFAESKFSLSLQKN
jgi:hypothetical protein